MNFGGTKMLTETTKEKKATEMVIGIPYFFCDKIDFHIFITVQ